jgi:Protein of unknown function (DUF3152)
VGGRRLDSRSGAVSTARPAPPPVPFRPIPDLPPARVRGSRPSGPLVASTAPAGHERTRPEREPAGRFRRFARRHGWRAYAVPVLAVATVITLADLALTSPAETGSAGAGASAAAEPSPGSPVRSPDAESPAPVTPGPTASAEGDAGPTGTTAPPAAQAFVERGAGTVSVVDGTSAVLGSGPLRRFAVEVEDGIEVDARAFAAAVAQTLGDPRSWGADGRMSFQRVGRAAVQAGQYDFKVSLISPGSMETYCPGVGTGGYTSCRYGERAVINLARWVTAVPHYDGDVATYRHYVVNHEVGHVLGNGHVDCPGAGQVAPVMLQQTLGLEGCAKNAWPHP